MNIVIVGQGAMGLLWHSNLQQLATPQITLSLHCSKPQTLDFVNYNYTHFNGLSEQRVFRVARQSDIEQANVLLICVKSYQLSQAVHDIARFIADDAVVILAHNGLGTLSELPDDLCRHGSILAMLTTQGCMRAMPRHVVHTGQGLSDLGLLQGKISPAQRDAITTLFHNALPQVSWHHHIIEKQWLKLAVNCVINPITAIYNVPNGEINKAIFNDAIEQVLTEIVAIARFEGVLLDNSELKKRIAQVATATAKNCSSMRADVLAKRKTENDYINGYIHRLGLQHRVATDKNTELFRKIATISRDFAG